MSNEIIAQNNTEIATTSFDIPKGYVCTIDTSTIAGKMKLANAINAADSLADNPRDVYLVTDFVTTPGKRNRTGELCTNTYIITDDGEIFFTQSDGIARSVQLLTGIFTDPITHTFASPVSLGVGVTIKETKMANGNTLKSLVTVPLED